MKKEIHRLVDSLPASETKAVKRFIESLLAHHGVKDLSESSYTLKEASAALELSPTKLRQLIRDGIVLANKTDGQWAVRREELIPWMDPIGLALLNASIAPEIFGNRNPRAIAIAMRDYVSGNTESLDEVKRQYDVGE